MFEKLSFQIGELARYSGIDGHLISKLVTWNQNLLMHMPLLKLL